MSYQKAADVLPQELIDKIQGYIDGAYLYIPRKETHKKAWGEANKSRERLFTRNMEIFRRYQEGMSVLQLSEIYYLSPKSIQKIIAKLK